MRAIMYSTLLMFSVLLTGAALSVQANPDPVLSGRLFDAVEQGNLPAARALLEKGADPNVKGPRSEPVLFAAIKRGDGSLVRLLLDRGADPNGKDWEGTTPLMCLFEQPVAGRSALARLLLSGGASLERTNNSGHTAADIALRRARMGILLELLDLGATVPEQVGLEARLFDAAQKGDSREVQRLISKGVDPNLKTIRARASYQAAAPLQLAVDRGHSQVVEVLLTGGADPEGVVQRGSPLASAITAGDTAVVRLLLQSGANVNRKFLDGRTPLLVAVTSGRGSREIAAQHQLEVVQALVAAGADVNATDREGRTAAFLAADVGYNQIADFLLASGAPVDKDILGLMLIRAIEEQDFEGVKERVASGASLNTKSQYRGYKTPLVAAVRLSRGDIVQFLIEKGAHPNLQGPSGETALLFAVQSAEIEMVKLLLQLGADVNIKDRGGRTPLIHAAAVPQTARMIPILKAAGADVNARDLDGRTALVAATQYGNVEGVKALRAAGVRVGNAPEVVRYAVVSGNVKQLQMLIALGANIETKDNDGASPLNLAAQLNNPEIARVLLDAGANMNARDREGFPPLYHAAYHGHFAVIKVLLDKGADVNAKVNGEPLIVLLARKILVVYVSPNRGGAWSGQPAPHVTPPGISSPAAGVGAVGIFASGAPSGVESAMIRDAQAARLLLHHGANPNVTDKQGLTPLIYAAGRGRLPLVRTLLAYGANVNAKGAYGITAWQVAVGEDVIEMLANARKNSKLPKPR